MHCTFVRDGKTCGAPTYQNPCATCVSYQRSLNERGLAAPAPAQPAPHVPTPMDFPKYRALHALFHHLWTKNVGGHLYDKKEWEEVEAGIEDIARNGLGSHSPAPIAHQYGDDLTASLGPSVPIITETAPSQPQVAPLPENLMTPITRPSGG